MEKNQYLEELVNIINDLKKSIITLKNKRNSEISKKIKI